MPTATGTRSPAHTAIPDATPTPKKLSKRQLHKLRVRRLEQQKRAWIRSAWSSLAIAAALAALAWWLLGREWVVNTGPLHYKLLLNDGTVKDLDLPATVTGWQAGATGNVFPSGVMQSMQSPNCVGGLPAPMFWLLSLVAVTGLGLVVVNKIHRRGVLVSGLFLVAALVLTSRGYSSVAVWAQPGAPMTRMAAAFGRFQTTVVVAGASCVIAMISAMRGEHVDRELRSELGEDVEPTAREALVNLAARGLQAPMGRALEAAAARAAASAEDEQD